MKKFELNEDIHQYPIRPKIIVQPKKLEHVWENSVNESYDMAVVTCHFNWCEFVNPKRNLHRFIRHFKIEKIPLYGVELSLTDQFETEGLKNWKRIKVSKENVCFQKEACINLVVNELVPSKYKKIAWIDADLTFTNKNWYLEGSKKLESYKIVQLFQYAIQTDRYGRERLAGQGSVFTGGPTKAGGRRAPGGAWAARRDLWNHGGLYSFCPLGGGDTVFLYALYENSAPNTISHVENRPDYVPWREKIHKYIARSISYVNGSFIHEWHGDREDRSYGERQELFSKIPQSHIDIDNNGLVVIHDESDERYNEIYNYFLNRHEDGQPISFISNFMTSKSIVYDYCVIITTYDNPEMLSLLLNDIKNNSVGKKVLTVVFDDGSPRRFDHGPFDIKYIKYVKNGGKQNYWKLVDDTFKYIKHVSAKYYFYLQDDVRMIDGYFEKAISIYENIPDRNKICLSTLPINFQINTSHFAQISPVKSDDYIKTQWTEFLFLVENKFFKKLNYEIFPINESIWTNNLLLESAVSKQISERLVSDGMSLYHTKNALLSRDSSKQKK
jgi:hypothetical protein